MAHATDIVGYTYKADLYCPECILNQVNPNFRYLSRNREAVEPYLDGVARARSIDRDDETTFDSGDFPKVVLRSMLGECDKCAGFGNGPSFWGSPPCTTCEATGTADRCGSCGKVLGE